MIKKYFRWECKKCITTDGKSVVYELPEEEFGSKLIKNERRTTSKCQQ